MHNNNKISETDEINSDPTVKKFHFFQCKAPVLATNHAPTLLILFLKLVLNAALTAVARALRLRENVHFHWPLFCVRADFAPCDCGGFLDANM